MPIVNEIFGNYGNQISDLLGNVNDVIVGDNYTKALQELAKFEDQKNQLARFENLNKNFLGLDLNNVPTKKQVQLPGFNFENPEFLNTDAGKKFMDDQTKVNPDAKNTKYTTKDIENYLSIHSPEAIENLKLDPRFYGLQQSEMPLNKDEYENEAYRTAGFTDEDIMFYNDYKNKKLDPKGFNKSIDVFVGKKMLDLMSQGSYGDSRAKMLANLGAGMKYDKDELMGPQYDTIKDSFDNTWLIEKGHPERLLKKLFEGKDNIRPFPGSKPYAFERDGKKFIGYVGLNKQNEATSIETEVKEEQSGLWEQIRQQSEDGGLGFEDRLGLKNTYNLNYKMDLSALGLLGGKGNKGGQPGLTLTEEEFKKKLLDFRDLSGKYDKLKGSSSEAYRNLQKELAPYFNNDWRLLNTAIEKIGNMTDKEQKGYINSLHVGELKSLVPDGQSLEGYTAAIRDSQKQQINDIFKDINLKKMQGELDSSQYNTMLEKVFQQLSGQLDSEMLKYLQDIYGQFRTIPGFNNSFSF